MPPKILVCLTCPAMTACVTPASFSRLMQVPSWPSEIQWIGGAVARGGVVQLGERLFLGGDDRDVVPLRARRVEHEERKPAVAGDQAQRMRRIPSGDELLGAPASAAAG